MGQGARHVIHVVDGLRLYADAGDAQARLRPVGWVYDDWAGGNLGRPYRDSAIVPWDKYYPAVAIWFVYDNGATPGLVGWINDHDNILPWTQIVSGPPTVSISSTRIKPGTGLTLTWTAGTGGTDNPIAGYKVYTKKGDAGLVHYGNASASARSMSVKLPSNTRGDSYRFTVQAYGTKDPTRQVGSAYSAVVTNNTLPGAPSPSPGNALYKNSQTTLGISATAGTGSGTRTVYYNTTNSTSGWTLLSGTKNVNLAVGNNYYYFWTWDGLEASSVVTRNYQRNSLPVLSGQSVTKYNSTFTDATYTPPTGVSFSLGGTIKVTTNKSGGTLSFYAKRTRSVDESAPWISLGSQAVTSAKAYSVDLSYLSWLSGANLNPFGWFIGFQAYWTDGTDSTSWETGQIHHTGGTAAIDNVWNNAAGNGDEGVASQFYRNLTFKHKVNSAVTYDVYWDTDPSGLNLKLLGTPTRTAGSLKYTNISGPTSSGVTYYFWLRSQYSQGLQSWSQRIDRKQVPDFPYTNLTMEGIVAPIASPDSARSVTFARQEFVNYSIPANSTPTFKLIQGSSTRAISTVQNNSAGNDASYGFKNKDAYPYTLNGGESTSIHNPFDLTFNRDYNVTIQLTLVDSFGKEHIGEIKLRTLSLKFTPQFISNWATNAEMNRIVGPDAMIPATEGMPIFQNEKVRFQFAKAITHNSQIITYSIIAQDDGVGPWVTLHTLEESNWVQAPIVVDLTVGQILVHKKRKYRLRMHDGVNAAVEAEFSPTLYLAQQGPPEITMLELDVSSAPNTVRWILPDLKGNAGTGEGSSYKKIEARLLRSTSTEFLPVETVSSETIKVLTKTIGAQTSPYGELTTDTGKTFSIQNALPPSEEFISYYRIELIMTPQSTGSFAQEVFVYSNVMSIYPNVADYKMREQYFGINAIEQKMDAAFEVQKTTKKRFVYLKNTESQYIVFDLEDLTVDGITIDGGEWE